MAWTSLMLGLGITAAFAQIDCNLNDNYLLGVIDTADTNTATLHTDSTTTQGTYTADGNLVSFTVQWLQDFCGSPNILPTLAGAQQCGYTVTGVGSDSSTNDLTLSTQNWADLYSICNNPCYPNDSYLINLVDTCTTNVQIVHGDGSATQRTYDPSTLRFTNVWMQCLCGEYQVLQTLTEADKCNFTLSGVGADSTSTGVTLDAANWAYLYQQCGGTPSLGRKRHLVSF